MSSIAANAKKRTSNRNYIHCLRCNKPQDNLSVHLTRVCMKKCSPEERAAELRKAKDSAKAWILNCRTLDYRILCEDITHVPSRIAITNRFLSLGFVISNRPQESELALGHATSTVAATSTADASTSTDDLALSVQPSPENRSSSSPSSDPDEGTSDPSWQIPPRSVTSQVRLNMKEAGLYDKFPEHTTLLADFKKYLARYLKVPDCKQEVENVSRFLRYVQPKGEEVNMDFLLKSTETRQFLLDLQDTKMKNATILNYIKNIIRFLDFLNVRLDLEQQHTDFRQKIRVFKDFLCTLRKPVSKGHSRDMISSRYQKFVKGTRSPKECQEILEVAKGDFLKTFGNLLEDLPVSEPERTKYRYYCETLLVLRHCQRPGAVQGLTAQEWVNRIPCKGRTVIGISQHKTATMQIATFALTQEEDAWLQMYFEKIRTHHIGKSECEKFFVSSSGQMIKSVTNDVSRFQESYKVTPCTSQEIRWIMETRAYTTCSEAQQKHVVHYLAHSNAVANTHDRMRDCNSVVHTAALMDFLAEGSSDSGQSSPTAQSSSREGRPPADFSSFTKTFPVTVEGQPPNKKARVDAGFSSDRAFYDKWRACQFGQRTEFLLSNFTHRKPSAGKVARLIQKEGWKANHPKPEDVVLAWKPAPKHVVETDKAVLKSVSVQRWKGLALKDFGEAKGLGVVATRNFSKGDIVCDYHGRLISAAEGREQMQRMTDEAGYLFFFKDLCIDAQMSHCDCHPGIDTLGRRINHSSKRPNLKPLHCVLKVDGEDRDVILFKALADIRVDTELKFDYSVNRKSFRGEGLELEWLDE